MKRAPLTKAICLASFCLAGSTCAPAPVGLVFTVEDAANLPAMTQYLSISLKLNGTEYVDANYPIPLVPYPHRYGLLVPADAGGEVKLTVRPLGEGQNRLSACGSEYQWNTTATLNEGVNEYKVLFTKPEGKFTNKNDLYASWSRKNFWTVGAGGTVLQYDGTCWTREQSPLLKPEYTFKAIWGLNDEEDDDPNNPNPNVINDLWVMGETSSGGTPQSVLLRRHKGVWTERGSLQGTVTAMRGLDGQSDDGSNIWIIGKNGTTPFLYFHKRKADNYVISKAPVSAYFELSSNESIADLTALQGSEALFIAAKINRAASTPYLILFKEEPVLNPPFRKEAGSVIATNPLPLSIDAMSARTLDEIWLAGAKLSPMPGANNKISIRRLELSLLTGGYQDTPFPDQMLFETSKLRLVSNENNVAYLAKVDDSAAPRPIDQPLVRCQYSAGTSSCAVLPGQSGRFPGAITSAWATNEGALWFTMSGGSLVRIDAQNNGAIETFVAP
jgi:hypothetical protein